MTLVVVAVSFAISNDAMISLSLWPFTQNLEIPIWLFGVGAFVMAAFWADVNGGQMLRFCTNYGAHNHKSKN